jgi:hypothetical protein
MPERGVMSGPVSELTWARNISIKLEIIKFKNQVKTKRRMTPAWPWRLTLQYLVGVVQRHHG